MSDAGFPSVKDPAVRRMGDPKVQAVIDAWLIEGPHPKVHQQAKDQLAREWPTLYRALEALTV